MVNFIKKNKSYFIAIIGFSLIFILAIFDTKNKNKKLDECSFYTIIHPIRMPDTHKLYFYYFLNNVKIESSASLSAEHYSEWINVKHFLSKRFLARINCTDKYVNRIYWSIPILDSLQHVPEAGWKEIPNGFKVAVEKLEK
jgi:hypothetical protein